MRTRALALLITVAAAGGNASTASAAPVRECSNYDPGKQRWTYGEVQGAGIFNVTSRVTRCPRARKITLRAPSANKTGKKVWRYRAWTCRYLRQEYEATDTRCTKSGGRVVRWQSCA